MMRDPTGHPGFVMRELVTALIVLAVLGAIALTLIFGRPKARASTDHNIRSSSQVRGVLMGFTLWSQSNQDRFPLPSLLDQRDTTVPDQGEAKNTTANILSILIFNSYFPPELLVEPQEANPNIECMDSYELDKPPTAVDPAHAVWDPALRADFTAKQPGNISYAHLLPLGTDPDATGQIRYGANQSPTQAVIGNRGPQITAITLDKNGDPIPTYAPVPGTGDSLTFRIHGLRTQWEGNIGYADNHVNFETRVSPEPLTSIATDAKARPDCLFFEEPDARECDNFLGIYIKAGAERKEFQTIWD